MREVGSQQYHRQRRGTGFDRYRYDPGAAGSAALALVESIPLANGRAMQRDVANVVAFQRRRTRDYVTGATPHVNGGIAMA